MIFDNKFKISRCSYCLRSGHVKKQCKMVYLHFLYKVINIPEKYWYEDDPVKSYLLNTNIKSYSIKKYSKNYKIY